MPMRSPSSAGGRPRTGNVAGDARRCGGVRRRRRTRRRRRGRQPKSRWPTEESRGASRPRGQVYSEGSGFRVQGSRVQHDVVRRVRSGAAWSTTPPMARARRSRTERVTAYIGFDPTASSLHVGIAAADHGAGAAAALRPHADRARRRRHRHDRRSERQVARSASCCRPSRSTSTSRGMRAQLERFLDFDARAERRAHRQQRRLAAAPSTCSTFLRDVGKHFTVELHDAKESVKPPPRRATTAFPSPSSATCCCRRTTSCSCSIDDGCTLQMGGSDQWGNITAGMRSDSQGARRRRRTAWCGRW